tara:strand:- start:377 stop:1507 length:1131 start_codon:yes stop_codon:yes gene_type:complete
MVDPEIFYKSLKSRKIDFYAGVPDSLLKYFCFYVSENIKPENHIIAANEGNALSLGIGYHLATNNIPLIYFQNSGLGNIINPLLSLADSDVYSIPMLLLIGWRGEPGVKDEPQHKKQGRVTLSLLKTMEIPYEIIGPDNNNNDVDLIVSDISKSIKLHNKPHAIVIKKNTFSEYKIKNNKKSKYSLNREESIQAICKNIDKDDVIVTTTGFTSREFFEYKAQSNINSLHDFLVIGGMGHASQIALGLALKKQNKIIYCLDGDGSLIMHMGSLAINASLGVKNFKHIIFNNGCHESVGGQPTVGHNINFQLIAKGCGYKSVLQAKTINEIKSCIQEIKKNNCSTFLEIMISEGHNKKLGRPTKTPQEIKSLLMNFIK